jgi:hypothetical protein
MMVEKPRESSLYTGSVPLPACPMGETCRRMMERPPSSVLMFVPGVVFIAVGVLIVVEPAILVSLIAASSILAGIAMVGCAYFMRAVGIRLMRTHHEGEERRNLSPPG